MQINFFPKEPSERVKYSMAFVNDLLNKTLECPTRENPIRLRGTDATMLKYIWTALMVWGQNHPTMKFGFKEIRADCYRVFNPKNEYQIGWFWSAFTPNSLYETVFKHYLTPDMLIPVDYPQAFEDVPVSIYKTIAEQEQFKIEEAQNPEEAWLQKEAKLKEEALKHEYARPQEKMGNVEESRKKEVSLQQERVLKEEKGKQTKVVPPIFFEKANELPSLNRLRTMVLCEAIERYLSWRNNKNGADKRGYNITSFTWFRHYTTFGENRAKQLMQKLLAPHEDCLNILKEHFSAYFSINNHSLDTYLLEAIWETKNLFPIHLESPFLDTIEARRHLLNTILSTDALAAPENPDTIVPCIVTYLFSELRLAHKDAISDYLAVCHQYERREDTNKELCFGAFALIAEAGIKKALSVLERMACEGNKEQQNRLSTIYREIFNNEHKATYWEKRAGNTMELGPI